MVHGVSLRHREKVLAHAEDKLASQGKLNAEERLALYKKFLKLENHRLRLRHNAGGGGREIARQRAMLVDIVLRHLYEPAMAGLRPEGLSLVAIGGYGRGELNPFSDVDIMFLHSGSSKSLNAAIAEVVQSILYMLWDIGFKVGHSTRSIGSAIKQANADMLSKTSMLEARLVAGDEGLFAEFTDQYVARCVEGRERDYINARIRNQAERHLKYGRTVYLQEPNLKNGCGGLRDYQNLLWMSFFKERLRTTAELVGRKFLAESERRELEAAYDFLLRVRTDLHYINERPIDSLSLNQQFKIADRFAYPQQDILRRTEAFMRDFYVHSRNIFRLTELLSQRLAINAEPQRGRRSIFGLIPGRKRKIERFDGFYAEGEYIYAESAQIFRDDPPRMMRLFQHAQLRQLRLSPELQQFIRRRLKYVNRTFQYSRVNRVTFMAILSRKGEVGRILRMMHEVDFLGRYIPEFGKLTCLVQHEFFHRYTADEHTLKCIEKLDELIDTDQARLQRYRRLFQEMNDPFVLYMALLLHDVGKASNAKHHAEASAVAAQRVARRLQVTPAQRRSMITLVDNHLTLSEVAQRRNVDDPATITEFATVVGSQTELDRLMLLTLADGQGTDDEKWSDWKEGLVWQLYGATSDYLEDSADFFRQRKVERDSIRKEVERRLPADFTDEIAGHFQHMPEDYFRRHQSDQIAAHLRLFREFIFRRFTDGGLALAPMFRWIARPEMGHSEVWICTWNRRELLARIAGSFAAEQINILSADIYTRTDDLVLDIFRVCDMDFQPVTAKENMASVEKHLTAALQDEHFDFHPLLARSGKRRSFHLSHRVQFPTRIVVSNESSPKYTLVEVQTPDRLGLLYSLLKAFLKLKIDIAMSRVATEKGAAIDTFYVSDAEGRKLTDKNLIGRMQDALHEAATSAPAKW